MWATPVDACYNKRFRQETVARHNSIGDKGFCRQFAGHRKLFTQRDPLEALVLALSRASLEFAHGGPDSHQ
jgi:hypothetical protein